MLTLSNLKRTRQRYQLKPADVVNLTGISRKRYGQLELHTGAYAEPWFTEATSLARIFDCTIGTLVSEVPQPDLTRWGAGASVPTDRDMWRSGLALDISTAVRLAIDFGLADPLYLVQPSPAMLMQIWSVVEAGERAAAPGNCVWCNTDIVGGAAHLPTCLPTNLLTPRARHLAPTVSFTTAPRQAGGGFGSSGLAQGLKRVREAHGLTQHQLGALFGASSDYTSKIERCTVNLLVSRAQCIANKLGIDVAAIYHL